MITFEKSFLLLLLPILICVFLLKKNFFKRCAFNFSIKNWQHLEKEKNNLAFTLYRTFFYLSMALIVISLSEPNISRRSEEFTSNSGSVMFVIDVSPSMSIVDINFDNNLISRLEASKKIIKSFLDKNKNIAVGLTAFATDSCILVPETTQEEIFLERVNLLRIGELGDKTSQGNALATALLHSENKKNSSIVLLTDGENNAGAISPFSVAEIIKKRETNFYIVGLGKHGEGKIEYTDFKTGQKIYGTSFKSVDEVALKQLSKIGQGFFTQATSFEDLNIPVDSISFDLEKNFNKISTVKKYKLTKIFSTLSLGFIILSFIIKHLVARVVF